MQQPILTPQQLEAYNRGEAVTIQKVKEVKRKGNEIDADYTFYDYIDVEWLWNNYFSFSTKEELQKQMQYIEAVSYIRTYIANNFGEWKPDWSDSEQRKWHPYYNYISKKWESNWIIAPHTSPHPYLKTEEMCEQLIKDCEPQLNIPRDFFN